MYEENKKFSWTNFFIKGIIVIIFILFAVWLLSLSNKGISNQLNVLTDNIFKENIDRMKEVGKSYFTTERLPQNVGEVKTLTLAKMYDEKLILEIKDKYGNACSATNSYVSVEKLEDEYQMKVYLECGEESDYIIVIMGCYDYCQFDICERTDQNTPNKQIEYEYKKTTGGKWTDYGSWSEWSKVSVTKTDYRQVETKVIKEEYSYNKTVYENEYVSFETSCPSGYNKTSDGKCVKYETKETYTKPNACAKEYNGYTLVSQDGFTCNYVKTVSTTVNANACPSTYEGYNFYAQDGLICKYSKRFVASIDYVYNCNNGCGMKPVYTYKYKYTTSKTTCPSGSVETNNTCVTYKKVPLSKTDLVSCPSGYNKSGNICSKKTTITKTADINKSCPSGYNFTDNKNQCYKSVSSVIKVTGTKDVTYYRYRIREYIGGTVDYKWSKFKEDKELLNAGYVLTGRTR